MVGDRQDTMDEEVLIDALVAALTQVGIEAASWQSGGGIYVALVNMPGKNDQVWGLAAGTWGGYDADEEGVEVPGTAVTTAITGANISAVAQFIASRA